MVFLWPIFFALVFVLDIIAQFTTDAPFVPIPKGIDDKIIESLKLKSESILYDLGCGDGRVLISVTKKNPDIKAIGVEKAFVPYFLAKLNTRNFKNISILREDIFKTDISKATHIFMYLYPAVIKKLWPLIQKSCKAGTRIISCDFQNEEMEPSEIIDIKSQNKSRGKKLFVYII